MAILFSHCSEQQKKDNPDITGGPCTYQTDTIPLTLIDTVQFANGNLDLVFTLSHPSFNDTIRYTEIAESYLNKNDSLKFNFDTTHFLLHHTLQPGSCTPSLSEILLIK